MTTSLYAALGRDLYSAKTRENISETAVRIKLSRGIARMLAMSVDEIDRELFVLVEKSLEDLNNA